MARVLYVQASPRGARSFSVAVADAFVDAYRAIHPSDEILRINLFEEPLMPFDGLAVQAKYTVLHGANPAGEEKDAWRQVERVVEAFKGANKYVFAVPMWNFGIPYRLKHYLDILVQPGYTFALGADGQYEGLLGGRRAFVAYARGGEYSTPEAQRFDMQKRYMELVLGFMGITEVFSVVVEPTIAGGPEVAKERLRAAVEEARTLAATL